MIRLFKYELSKIIKNKLTIGSFLVSLIILFGILFVGYIYSQNYSSQIENEKNGYPKNIDKVIQEKYTGNLTNNTVDIILSDYICMQQSYSNDNSFPYYQFYWDFGSLLFSDSLFIVNPKIKEATKKEIELQISDFNIKNIDDLNFKIAKKDLIIGNYVPWGDFFKTLGNVFFLCNILIIFICSKVFSDDTSKNINQLLFTTKNGRRKMNAIKICIGFIISIAIFIFFQGINYLFFSNSFDISGGISSIQTNLSMKLFEFSLPWNHWITLLFIIVLQLLGILLTTGITLTISSFCKTSLSSVSVSLLIFFLPYFSKKVVRTDFFNIFPINFSNSTTILEYLDSGYLFKASFQLNAVILFSFLIIFTIIFVLISYIKMKKWNLK